MTASSAASASSGSLPSNSEQAIGDWLQEQVKAILRNAAAVAYSRHRLKFVHKEDDGSLTYICICGEGFSERRHWNFHIRDSFIEVV